MISGYRKPYMAQMEDERQKALVEQLRQQQTNAIGYTPEGMQQASRDLSGEKAVLSNQMDYANQLRGQPNYQATSIGGIAAFNPWEAAARGIEKGVGGYMAGKASQGMKKLSKEQEAVNLAALEAENAKTSADLERADEEKTYSRGQDAAKVEREQKAAEEKLAWDAAMETRRRQESERDREVAEIINPDTGDVTFVKKGQDMPSGYMSREMYESRYGDYGDRLKANPFSDLGVDSEELDQAKIDYKTTQSIMSLGSAVERKDALTAVLAVKEMSKAAQYAAEAIEEGVNFASGGKDLLVAGAESVGGILGDSGRKAARNMAKEGVFDEKAKNIRGRIDRSVTAFLRAEGGANLTDIELKLGENWNPMDAKDEAEAIRRMEVLAEYMNEKLKLYGIPQQDFYSYNQGSGDATRQSPSIGDGGQMGRGKKPNVRDEASRLWGEEPQ